MLSLRFGAGEESRTLDLNLGKVALYQLQLLPQNELRIIGIFEFLSIISLADTIRPCSPA